ncbi:hypothetical protein NMG60_11026883 [Bertholletia excelsa]
MCVGFESNERERLRIKGFYFRLSVPDAPKPLPDLLTLYFLPRINGTPLYINGSRIGPDSPGFVVLHRVVSAEAPAIFGSRERVTAGEGARFEVYLGDEKVLKGVFRKDEGDEWKMECKCVLEREVGVKTVQVCVPVEGHIAMSEKVEMVVRRRRRGKYCFQGLEEIPEEREVDDDSDGCCRRCTSESEEMEAGSESSDGRDCEAEETELDIEGLRWAVDVGIWLMCLGVGYLVSKASSKSLRRRRLL